MIDGTEEEDVELLSTPAGETGSGVLGKMSSSSPGVESMRSAGQALIGDPNQFVRQRDQGALDYSTKIDEAIRRLRAPPDDSRVHLPLLKIASAFLAPTRTGSFAESLSKVGDIGADAIGRQRQDEERRASAADNLELQKSQFLFRDTTERMQLGQQLLNAAETADARRLQAEARAKGPLGQVLQVLEAQGVKPGSPEGRRALRAYGNRLIYGESANRQARYQIIQQEDRDEQGNPVYNQYRYNMDTNKKDLIGPIQRGASGPSARDPNAGADVVGVPMLPRDPYADYTDPKKREQAMIAGERATDRQYNEIMKRVPYSQDMVDKIERAKQLVNEIPDNEFGGTKGIVSANMPYLMSPKMREFHAIVSQLTPTMRAPGSGSTSDFDAKMFREGLFGVDKPVDTNRNMITGQAAQLQRNGDYLAYLNDYRSVHRTLQGADQKWREYVSANPIFDKRSNGSRIILNNNRQSYQDFFREQNKAARTPIRLGE